MSSGAKSRVKRRMPLLINSIIVVWQRRNGVRHIVFLRWFHLFSDRFSFNWIPIEELRSDLPSAWNRFYGIHENKFFKDRQWLFTEFPELIVPSSTSSASSIETPIRLLEVGCGVGNSIFPIIRTNNLTDHANLFIYCCDYSATAIEILKQNEEYNPKYVHAFVYDLTNCAPLPFEENSLDLILMIFVLSAIEPTHHDRVIAHLVKYLKPGKGKLLFRDYGLYDMAQLRFKSDKCIERNLYARSDGTLTYFFQQG